MSDSNEYYPSCDICRTRKFKCTKERPVCNPCLKVGLDCKYSRKVSRTPLTRNNLKAAEDRVQHLETVFAALFPGIALDTILSSVQSENSGNSSGSKSSQPSKKASHIKVEENRDRHDSPESLPRNADGFDWSESAVSLSEISDGMAALSINPEGAGYLGATSSVVPLRALLNKERNIDQSLGDSPDWNNQSLLSHQVPSLFPENVLVDAYFRYYHPTYPFLYEPLFRSQFEDKNPKPEGNSWFILLNAVLALGAWCIGDDDSVVDDFFYRKIRMSEENPIFETGNLAMVQGLLLLSNYAQKRNRPNTGWNYLGLAVRMALSLGLHKEFPNWEITLLDREMRRRVWWGLFIFDSGASITFGRPVLLPQSGIMDASQVLNIHEESLTPHTALLPAEISSPTIYTALISQSLFHLNTNGLHHRLISTPSPSPQELIALELTIHTWEESIPSYFQLHSLEIQSNETLLFARYRLSWRSWNLKIILFRPILLQWAGRLRRVDSKDSSVDTNDELECRNQCTQSASATINSISDFMAKGMTSRLSNWYLLYFLFQAGLVPIICLTGDPTHQESQMWFDDILTTKDLLSRTATSNRLAGRCLEVFDRLSPMVVSGELEQLGAWRADIGTGFPSDQFAEGVDFWDWANNEMNWTI